MKPKCLFEHKFLWWREVTNLFFFNPLGKDNHLTHFKCLFFSLDSIGRICQNMDSGKTSGPAFRTRWAPTTYTLNYGASINGRKSFRWDYFTPTHHLVYKYQRLHENISNNFKISQTMGCWVDIVSHQFFLKIHREFTVPLKKMWLSRDNFWKGTIFQGRNWQC